MLLKTVLKKNLACLEPLSEGRGCARVATTFVKDLVVAGQDSGQDRSHNWAGPPHVENHYLLDWLNCFVKNNQTACDLARCQEPQHNIPTTTCIAADPPTIDNAMIV